MSADYTTWLDTNYGVITWLTGSGGTSKCILRTYDPGPGVWKAGELVATNVSQIAGVFVADGVVAWSLRTELLPPLTSFASALFAVYDPSRGDWRYGDASIAVNPGEFWPDILVNQATVFFGDYRYGYNATSGVWISGLDTPPFSCFVPQPTTGNAPLWVWFTDMSIGSASWTRAWTFGDGGTSMDRSPSYTYGTIGKFTVIQQVSGAGMDNSSSQEVTVSSAGTSSVLYLLLP